MPDMDDIWNIAVGKSVNTDDLEHTVNALLIKEYEEKIRNIAKQKLKDIESNHRWISTDIKEREAKWDLRFLNLCRFVACWSKDPSTKCGSVIVRDVNRIVSVGYNGYPRSVDDDETLHVREEKYKRVVHAEANAIIMAQKALDGMTLYVHPLLPCSNCASHIIQAGIIRVVSVVPSDPVLRSRWEESNSVAVQMFKQARVELKIYQEEIDKDGNIRFV